MSNRITVNLVISLLYLFLLILIFGVSSYENKYVLLLNIFIFVEVAVIIPFYLSKKLLVFERVAFLLACLLVFYFLSLYLTFPLSLIFISSNKNFAAFQKNILTGLRTIISVQILLVVIFTLWFKVRKKINRKDKFVFFSFFISLFISLLIPVDVTMVKVIYFLYSFLPLFLIFALLYFLLNTLYRNRNKALIESLCKYLTPSFYFLAFIIAVFNIVGLIFYLYKWEGIDVRYLYELKGYEPLKDLPRSWWFQIGDSLILRFSSTLENPIIAGYINAFLSITFFAFRKVFLGSMFFLFTLLSLSKGAMLFLSMMSFLLLVKFSSNSFYFLLKKIINSKIGIIFSVIMYISFQIIFSLHLKTSASVHLLGLTLPFLHIGEYNVLELLFGHGIGSGGNFYKGFMNSTIEFTLWLKTGAESGIGTIFFQTGLVGLTLFLIVLLKVYSALLSYESKFILLLYLLNLLLQEDLINFNYLIVLFVVILVIEVYNAKFMIYKEDR